MELIDYIEWHEGREDETPSVNDEITYTVEVIDGVAYNKAESDAAVCICYNCHRTTETLYPVMGFDFMGCGDCLDDALEQEAAPAASFQEAA